MKPCIYISNYQGRLGNHMFQFAWAKALSLELDYELSVPGIACDPSGDSGSLFPKTHGFKRITPEEYSQISDRFIELSENVDPFIKNSYVDVNYFKEHYDGKSIRGVGFFQNFHSFKKHKKEIKEYFDLDYLEDGKGVLGVQIRLDDCPSLHRCTGDYYIQCIKQSQCDKIAIFTDEPTHPFISQLKQMFPNIWIDDTFNPSGENNKKTLSRLSSCDEIAISRSTYSWWAAYLSNANTIYFPVPRISNDNEYFPTNQVFVDNEPRYVKVVSN